MIGQDIQKAADLLKKGDLVAIPTETVYGLAANALDTAAVYLVGLRYCLLNMAADAY